jgi:hypothetical protein
MLQVTTQLLYGIQYAVYLFATCWKVRGPNASGGQISRTRQDLPLNPTTALCNGKRSSFSGLKRLERGFDYPSLSSAEGKERVVL